jgi:hypothetical protein
MDLMSFAARISAVAMKMRAMLLRKTLPRNQYGQGLRFCASETTRMPFDAAYPSISATSSADGGADPDRWYL